MAQNINLSVSGIYTSLNDYNGLPPGALDIADNVECRYKNVLEPRRGFEGLPNSFMEFTIFRKITNYYVAGVDRIIAHTSDGDLRYYTGADPWPLLPGSVVTNVLNPDDINGKVKFVSAGQNLYITARDGVRSLPSGSSSNVIRAGVPKALNLEAQTNGDTSGFFDINVALATTGDITTSSDLITNLASTAGLAVGQYVGGTDIPVGSKIIFIQPEAVIVIQTGTTTATNTVINSVPSISGIVAGVLVAGEGIPDGAKVVTTGGGGPFSVVLDQPAFRTATGVELTFSSPLVVNIDQNATGTASGTPLTFYAGSQVGYRMVFGRVDMDRVGGSTTRLGSPSAVAICVNISPTPTNTVVTGTLPKNAQNEIQFVQLYRSSQTDSVDIPPLDQYNLVYERELTPTDFLTRTISITDEVPDSLVGIPLYTGSDQEGILQSNDPPPMCWDMCRFRDFVLYANLTRPTTLQFTIVGVGSPNGVQIGDQITIAGTFLETPFTQTYTAASGENPTAREFQIFSGGTPSQNIANTTNSLIRVINFDEDLPIHAILLSSSTDLPGQILLEADNPSYDTFTINASANQDAYDPELDNITSEVNTINNGVAISKSGELEAVPITNLLAVGDTSSEILRIVPLRDFVVALKTDGIYKIQGVTPNGLLVNPFDLTTKIIGAETAVTLNSAVWMMSNQGVVSISDGGVDAKSIPIDDQLNRLIGTYLDNLTDVSFAVGYESDRKYILCVPDSDNPFAQIEYNFNYVTQAWTTWSRPFITGFIHSNEGRLYVSRANGGDEGISRERKQANYKDYVDEGIPNFLYDSFENQVQLDNVSDVEPGDILFQDDQHFSPILAVDLLTSIVTVQYSLSFVPGAVQIFKAYKTTITWKQVFGDNPAFVRQYSEGTALFKNTRFNVATARFVTDFSQSEEDVTLFGTGNSLWGLFGWGEVPWGGTLFPSKIRFLIPQGKQLGSYLLPSIVIKQGYSDFKFQGLAITYFPVSPEVGLT